MDMSSRRARLTLAVAAVLALGGVFLALSWSSIRVRMILGTDDIASEKARALLALGPDALPALVDAYGTADVDFADRVTLGRIIVREPHRRVGVLENGLGDGNVAVRRVSAFLLVDTGNDDDRSRILAVLEAWIEDPRWGHRGELVGALARLANPLRDGGEPRSRALLARILERDEEESEVDRVQAARILGGIGDREITDVLVRVVRSDSSDKVRASALRALAAGGWDEDLTLFERVAGSEDSSARLWVANALSGLERPDAEPLLKTLLGDRAAHVRRAALVGLTRLRSRVIGEEAPLLLEDADRGVRRELVLAIQDLGLKEHVPLLVAGMREKEPDDYFEMLRLIVPALHKLTGRHHGFDAAYFTRPVRSLSYEVEFMRAWTSRPEEARAAAFRDWTEEFGDHDRRPALLSQLRHADPANVARAVRELGAMRPDAPTPGFTPAKVAAARTDLNPRRAPFLDLVDEARMFRALPEARRSALLDEWERLFRESR